MSSSKSIFTPAPDDMSTEVMVDAAVACVRSFSECFNARDMKGMDAHLHFPHAILSGEELIVWERPGNLPVTFFEDLSNSSGWMQSTYHRIDVVLVSPRKVHLLVEYSRDDEFGCAITKHENIWVVTFDDERWGIKLRSY